MGINERDVMDIKEAVRRIANSSEHRQLRDVLRTIEPSTEPLDPERRDKIVRLVAAVERNIEGVSKQVVLNAPAKAEEFLSELKKQVPLPSAIALSKRRTSK